MSDFGTDLRALDDLPLRDDLVTGEESVAYALARRLLTGNLADCGDPADYQSVDLRAKIGTRLSDADLAELQSDARSAIGEEERAEGIDATLDRVGGDLVVAVDAGASAGPFSLVVGPDAVTLDLLE